MFAVERILRNLYYFLFQIFSCFRDIIASSTVTNRTSWAVVDLGTSVIPRDKNMSLTLTCTRAHVLVCTCVGGYTGLYWALHFVNNAPASRVALTRPKYQLARMTFHDTRPPHDCPLLSVFLRLPLTSAFRARNSFCSACTHVRLSLPRFHSR